MALKKKANDSSDKRKTRSAAKKEEDAKKKPTKKAVAKGKAMAEEVPAKKPRAGKTPSKPTKIATKPATPAANNKTDKPNQMKTRIAHAIKANPDPKGPTRTTLKRWIMATFTSHPTTENPNDYSFEEDFDETIQRQVAAGKLHYTTGNHQRVEITLDLNAPLGSVPKKVTPKKVTPKK
ncbi:hypothetical protein BG000_011545, partial [Podila horticola]